MECHAKTVGAGPMERSGEKMTHLRNYKMGRDGLPLIELLISVINRGQPWMNKVNVSSAEGALLSRGLSAALPGSLI